MQYKVSELAGALLDVAVAKAEGGGFDPHRPEREMQLLLSDGRRVLAGPQADETKEHEWSPSTRWDHGGPIIYRERIAVSPGIDAFAGWWARGTPKKTLPSDYQGPTPLIAAMRAFVAGKFGQFVDLS